MTELRHVVKVFGFLVKLNDPDLHVSFCELRYLVLSVLDERPDREAELLIFPATKAHRVEFIRRVVSVNLLLVLSGLRLWEQVRVRDSHPYRCARCFDWLPSSC